MAVVEGAGGGPGVGSYEYGFNGQEVVNLIEAINTGAVTNAGGYAVENTSIIKSVAQLYWEGTSEKSFEMMLDRDAKTFQERVTTLVNAVNQEISNASASYNKFDDELMSGIWGGN